MRDFCEICGTTITEEEKKRITHRGTYFEACKECYESLGFKTIEKRQM